MRLIDADALLENFHKKRNPQEDADSTNQRHRYMQFLEDCEAIRNAPTIDAVPARHGKWIDEGRYADYHPHHAWLCSECGEQVIEIETPWYKYCPNCGAKMDGEEE